MMAKSVALILALMVIGGCAGTKARDEVLMPTMSLAWPGIAVDVEYGAQEMEDAAEAQAVRAEAIAIGEALGRGDRPALLTLDWNGVQGAALRGIQARITSGEIGHGVAQSLVERIRNFDAAWRQAVSR